MPDSSLRRSEPIARRGPLVKPRVSLPDVRIGHADRSDSCAARSESFSLASFVGELKELVIRMKNIMLDE